MLMRSTHRTHIHERRLVMTDVNRTDATATADARGVMNTAGQQAFETELRRLRASNTGGVR
jgi:hypothetical protein